MMRKDRPLTSAYREHTKPDYNSYLNADYNSKKDWDKSFNDYGKMKSSKSTKQLKFSDQNQHNYDVFATTTTESSKYTSNKKENLKSVTMSLGAGTKLKDLLPNFKNEDSKYK